jgi:hypothetical protein
MQGLRPRKPASGPWISHVRSGVLMRLLSPVSIQVPLRLLCRQAAQQLQRALRRVSRRLDRLAFDVKSMITRDEYTSRSPHCHPPRRPPLAVVEYLPDQVPAAITSKGRDKCTSRSPPCLPARRPLGRGSNRHRARTHADAPLTAHSQRPPPCSRPASPTKALPPPLLSVRAATPGSGLTRLATRRAQRERERERARGYMGAKERDGDTVPLPLDRLNFSPRTPPHRRWPPARYSSFSQVTPHELVFGSGRLSRGRFGGQSPWTGRASQGLLRSGCSAASTRCHLRDPPPRSCARAHGAAERAEQQAVCARGVCTHAGRQ